MKMTGAKLRTAKHQYNVCYSLPFVIYTYWCSFTSLSLGWSKCIILERTKYLLYIKHYFRHTEIPYVQFDF